MVKYPSPRIGLRVPTPPGNVTRKASNAFCASEKMFGSPLSPVLAITFLNTPVEGSSPICVAEPVNSQLVGNWKPLPIETGSPVVILKSDENCQPPNIASTNPDALLKKRRFLPIGISQMPLMFNCCVMSKSETALRAVGLQEFRIGPANSPLRSIWEATSVLLLHV